MKPEPDFDHEEEEERPIRVRKRHRTTGGAKDYLKNPHTLEFPDPWRVWRPILIGLFLVLSVVTVAYIMIKLSGPGQGTINRELNKLKMPGQTK